MPLLPQRIHDDQRAPRSLPACARGLTPLLGTHRLHTASGLIGVVKVLSRMRQRERKPTFTLLDLCTHGLQFAPLQVAARGHYSRALSPTESNSTATALAQHACCIASGCTQIRMNASRCAFAHAVTAQSSQVGRLPDRSTSIL